jgi:hypothetical protein
MAPEKGGSPWTEVTTAHFVLKTDLDPSTAQEASAKLEEIFAALAEFGFPSTETPKLRIDVVYFRSHDEYVVFAPQLSGGSFFPNGLHDFEQLPIALLGGDFVQATRETLQHELTHLFIHYYYPQAPVWLNEGLAEFMETMTIEDGLVVLGRETRKQRFWKGDYRWHADPTVPTGGTALLPMSDAPAPADLRGMSPAEFYGNRELDPRTNEGHEAVRTMAVHYTAAWTLVHLLLTNDTYTSTFGKYLERIHAGVSEGVAWQETLGRMSADGLEQDYRQALVPKEVMLLRAKWSAPPYAAESNRVMTGSEVHVLSARLRPETPEGRAAAEADFAHARQLNEAEEELSLVQAYRLAEDKRIAEGEETLRATLVGHPRNPRLWNALGRLMLREAAEDSGAIAPPTRKALVDIAQHLTPIATSSAQLDLLARVSAMQGNLDAALALEKRAVAADPNCVPCLAEAARLFYAKGLVREALETATLALGLLPEGKRMPMLSDFIESCRARLAASTESPAPGTKPTAPPSAAAKTGGGGR